MNYLQKRVILMSVLVLLCALGVGFPEEGLQGRGSIELQT